MAHVVIIGASTGGLPAAYDLRATLGKNHLITVISNSDTFQFVPLNPRVAVGWRSRQDTTFELAPYLAKKHIAFIPVAAQEIKPDTNQVILADGGVLDYDYPVIATGPKLAFDEVEGRGPRGHTHSVCTIDHAEKTYRAWQAFLEDPGYFVVVDCGTLGESSIESELCTGIFSACKLLTKFDKQSDIEPKA